jgi:molecular chaperone GrpE (heat shock protein)
MSNQTEPKLFKWPFFLGDVILLGLAYLIYKQHGAAAMGHWEAFFFLLCGVTGAMLAILPFLLEYRTAVKMVETGALVSTVAEIRNLELLAVQINAATARWQVVQEHSANSVTAAKEVAENMAGEAASFREFLQKANDSEKSNLRLEVEKSRRMENDWLQVIVRMLDHTYALNKAAERTGQQGLIEQLGNFQTSCRDVARRVGLVPFVPAANEPFDAGAHQLADPQVVPEGGAKVGDTIATGYTYQGRLIRPALVELQRMKPAFAAVENTEPVSAELKHQGSQEALEEQALL